MNVGEPVRTVEIEDEPLSWPAPEPEREEREFVAPQRESEREPVRT